MDETKEACKGCVLPACGSSKGTNECTEHLLEAVNKLSKLIAEYNALKDKNNKQEKDIESLHEILSKLEQSSLSYLKDLNKYKDVSKAIQNSLDSLKI